MSTKVFNKSSELIDILSCHLSGKMNLAHIKFISLMLVALCKVQSVCFEKLVLGFESKAKKESSLRRIQRFMAGYALDVDLIARLIFNILPSKPPYVLSLDRTNWKFGKTNINILVLAINCQGIALPILFHMIDKRGNSNTEERIELIERYIRLFGCQTINELLADRVVL